jgi:Caspase domain
MAFSVARPQGCGTAYDYLVAARQRCRPNATPEELKTALRYLDFAKQLCFSLGDAWYYRYLIQKQLGDGRSAENSLAKAKQFGSEALDRNDNPFVLSTTPAVGAVPSKEGVALAREGVSPAKEDVSKVVHDKWALVVGISKFREVRINLGFPAKDAKDFFAVLTDKNYGRFKSDHVHLLTDEKATLVQIKYELEWLRQNAREDDLVVIYLSSHGSPGGVDPEGISYIVTYDTDATEEGLYSTALPMVDIVTAVQNRIKARKAVVFLDTCYSGAALKGSRSLVTKKAGVSESTLERFRDGVGRVIVTASQADEQSWESEGLKNGYFTYYLTKALKENNGLTPIEQVYAYLKNEVSKRVYEDLHKRQTPSMKQSEHSTYISIGTEPSQR